jgi:hypothetical protein
MADLLNKLMRPKDHSHDQGDTYFYVFATFKAMFG